MSNYRDHGTAFDLLPDTTKRAFVKLLWLERNERTCRACGLIFSNTFGEICPGCGSIKISKRIKTNPERESV